MGSYAKLLTKKDVADLGCALLKVADEYPLTYKTERDFYPLVMAYLSGRVPSLRSEYTGEHGKIDFRIGGNNPSVLELAVAPRAFRDANDDALVFRGHQQATHLYARTNRSELLKLATTGGVKARYLLLVNLRAPIGLGALRASYERELPKDKGNHPVIVVYVFKNGELATFTVGGKKKGRKRASVRV